MQPKSINIMGFRGCPLRTSVLKRTQRCCTFISTRARDQAAVQSPRVTRRKALAASTVVVCGAGGDGGAAVAMSPPKAGSGSGEAWREGRRWEWSGHSVRWSVLGEDKPGTPLLLVHGFGASLEHWRYNAPELAEDRPVFVIDLLGFGFSDKPTVPNGFKCWGGHVWARQLSSFVDQVIKKPVVLVGNSLGGYSALLAASATSASVAGLVLVNSAGPMVEEGKQDDPFWALADDLDSLDAVEGNKEGKFALSELLKRIPAYLGFLFLRTERRVLATLSQVGMGHASACR